MNPRRPFARPAELSAYIGKPETTLKQWRWQGSGPRFYRIGRDVRYDWADVDAWLATQVSDAA